MPNLNGFIEKENFDKVKIYQDEIQLTRFKVVIRLKT